MEACNNAYYIVPALNWLRGEIYRLEGELLELVQKFSEADMVEGGVLVDRYAALEAKVRRIFEVARSLRESN
jgi:hypothetical protein